ncbi:hypothetical protein CC2G_010292 [Coprinopsis cinerea AmutBmut pab1-1]|nr:hypothetical protein CC2G_010292 [Coprinopsis cinerea AmutBmut pab1-1]
MSLNAEAIVADFKASGEFEKLKTEIHSQFMSDEFLGALRNQIQEIVKSRIQNDEMLTYMPQAHALDDLQQNINRDGVVDRFITEEYLTKLFSEEAVSNRLRDSLENIIKAKMEALKGSTNKPEAEAKNEQNPPKSGPDPSPEKTEDGTKPDGLRVSDAMEIDPKPDGTAEPSQTT